MLTYYFDECKVTKQSRIIKNNPAIMYEMAGLLYEMPYEMPLHSLY